MPTTPAELADYRRKIQGIRKQLLTLEDGTVRDVRKLFARTRIRIDEMVREAQAASAIGKGISADRYTILRRRVESELAVFQREATELLTGRLPETLRLGQAQVVEGLDGIFGGAIGLMPDVTAELATVMSQLSADLVKGITDEARQRLNTVLSQGLLGQKSGYELMADVDMTIGTKAAEGVSAKAERIVRTEIGQGHNMAHQAKLSQVDKAFPGLEKTWYHMAGQLDPRPGHREADGQTVPVNKPFMVSPRPGHRKEPLDYPCDLTHGSGANTVNCHCWMTIDPASIDKALSKAEQIGLVPSL